MKAVAVFLLFLGVISFSYAQLCPAQVCVKGGEICTGNQTIGCRGDSYCSTGTGTGICLIPARLGDFCDESQGLYCESGANCDNGLNICTAVIPGSRYLYPGEKCSNDVQCAGYDSPFSGDDSPSLCRSGHCRHTNVGDYCSNPGGVDQCDYTKAYCSRSFICEKYIKKGGACNYQDATSSGCGRGRDCLPNAASGQTGTCKDTFSQKEGQFCRTSNSNQDCDEGLYCYKAPLSTDTYGVCRKPANTATLNQPCVTSLQCNTENHESCVCNSNNVNNRSCAITGIYPGGWRDAYKNFVDCVRTKGCDTSDYNCLYHQCHSQTCKYYKTSLKQASAQKSCTFEGFCNSGFALVASPILAILMLAVAFIF